jgi:hypothetical protein
MLPPCGRRRKARPPQTVSAASRGMWWLWMVGRYGCMAGNKGETPPSSHAGCAAHSLACLPIETRHCVPSPRWCCRVTPMRPGTSTCWAQQAPRTSQGRKVWPRTAQPHWRRTAVTQSRVLHRRPGTSRAQYAVADSMYHSLLLCDAVLHAEPSPAAAAAEHMVRACASTRGYKAGGLRHPSCVLRSPLFSLHMCSLANVSAAAEVE